MSRDKTSGTWADAKCPYFRDESRAKQKIMCSGCEPGQTVQLFFRSETKRQTWLKEKCCSWNYGHCPMHVALATAEEEEEARG